MSKKEKQLEDTGKKLVKKKKCNLPPETFFKPGQSGNPNGRPKGARNRFTNQFYIDLAEDWQAHGKEAMQRVRKEDPSTYLRVAASLLPKDITIRDESATLDRFLDGLNDEQLDELIIGLRSLGAVNAGSRDPKAPTSATPKSNGIH